MQRLQQSGQAAFPPHMLPQPQPRRGAPEARQAFNYGNLGQGRGLGPAMRSPCALWGCIDSAMSSVKGLKRALLH